MAGAGFVCVLSCEAMARLLRVTVTSDSPRVHAHMQSRDGHLPAAYDLVGAFPVLDLAEAQRVCHNALASSRYPDSADFFRSDDAGRTLTVLQRVLERHGLLDLNLCVDRPDTVLELLDLRDRLLTPEGEQARRFSAIQEELEEAQAQIRALEGDLAAASSQAFHWRDLAGKRAVEIEAARGAAISAKRDFEAQVTTTAAFFDQRAREKRDCPVCNGSVSADAARATALQNREIEPYEFAERSLVPVGADPVSETKSNWLDRLLRIGGARGRS
jgi:hypothetical protein